MGPALTYHLGGGPGGLQHFFDHPLGGLFAAWWETLGAPTLTPALEARMRGVVQEAAGRTVELSRPNATPP